MTDTIQRTSDWFTKADTAIKEKNPEGTDSLLTSQIGFHFEEVKETIGALSELLPKGEVTHLAAITALADLREGYITGKFNQVKDVIRNPLLEEHKLAVQELVDGLGDTIVTATGVLNRSGVDPVEVMKRINDSNYTKFDESGNPIINEFGKIGKSTLYKKPEWDDLI